jgi:hypothetical protein
LIPYSSAEVELVSELNISSAILVGLNTVKFSKWGNSNTNKDINCIPVKDTCNVPIVFSLSLVEPEVD